MPWSSAVPEAYSPGATSACRTPASSLACAKNSSVAILLGPTASSPTRGDPVPSVLVRGLNVRYNSDMWRKERGGEGEDDERGREKENEGHFGADQCISLFLL